MVKNDIEKLIVVNVYVPCEPVVALEFMESVYGKVYEMDKHTDDFFIREGIPMHV